MNSSGIDPLLVAARRHLRSSTSRARHSSELPRLQAWLKDLPSEGVSRAHTCVRVYCVCVWAQRKEQGVAEIFRTQDAVLEDVADVGNAASLSDVVPVDGRAPKRLRVAVREAVKTMNTYHVRVVRDLLVCRVLCQLLHRTLMGPWFRHEHWVGEGQRSSRKPGPS